MEWANYISKGVPPYGRERKLIGGNWKCKSIYFINYLEYLRKIQYRLFNFFEFKILTSGNGTIAQVKSMVTLLNNCGTIPLESEVVIAVPSLHLLSVKDMIRSDIAIASEVRKSSDFDDITIMKSY